MWFINLRKQNLRFWLPMTCFWQVQWFTNSTFCTQRSTFNIFLNLVFRLPAAVGISNLACLRQAGTSYFLPDGRFATKQSIAYHKLMRLVWEQVAFEHRPFVHVSKA